MTKICSIFVALSVCVPLIWQRSFNLFEKFINDVAQSFFDSSFFLNAKQCFPMFLTMTFVWKRKRKKSVVILSGVLFHKYYLSCIMSTRQTMHAHFKFWIRSLTFIFTLSRDISFFCPYLPAEWLIRSIIKTLFDDWIIFNYWIILKVRPIDYKNSCLI